MFKAVSFTVTVFVLCVAPAFAQTTLDLDTIVVTGTRTERKLRDVPVRTEVIDRAELEKTHARDLVEALRYQPGIILQKIHGKSGYEVIMQGVGSDRVLVLIDGRPVTPSTGSTVDLSQIAVSDVEQIEIVKGATSAQHGSSAIGGVINIITRKPDDGFNYGITLDAGSWGDKNLGDETDLASRHLKTDISLKQKSWFGSLLLDVRDSDGFDLDPDTYTASGDAGDKTNLNLELGWTPTTETELVYRPSFYREDLAKRVGEFEPGPGWIEKTKTEKVEKISHALFYDRALADDAALSAYFVVEDFDDKTTQDVNSTPAVEGRRHAELAFEKFEIQYDTPLTDDQVLTTGLVLFHNTLDQTREGKSETLPNLEHENIEVFVQDDIFIGDSWELLPGIRLQDDSDFGFHAVAKINAMYIPRLDSGAEMRIRFGVGQGYRIPDLKERGYVFDHSSIGYVVLGSEVDQWEDTQDGLGLIDLSGAQLLEPEESLSLQLGLEYLREGDYRIDLSLFYNEIDNLIETDLYEGSEVRPLSYSVYRYVNIDRARTRGFDLAFDKRLTSALRFDAGYNYLDAIDVTTGNDLVYRPDHQLRLGFDWELPQWRSEISLRATWQSEEFTDDDNENESPSWHSLDVKYNYRYSQRLTLFAGIDNLTDVHKDPAEGERDRRPEEGRFIYAGLRFQGS